MGSSAIETRECRNGTGWTVREADDAGDEERGIFEINETEIRREFPFNGNHGNAYRSREDFTLSRGRYDRGGGRGEREGRGGTN